MIDTRMISLDLLEQNTGQIEGLPANPREWTKKEVDALAKSLRETPELFEARPIIAVPHAGKYVILGGNLRYEGCRKNGDSEAPVCVLPEDTPVVKMKEIVIKDNGSFGAWDYDRLGNEWDDLPLPEWGVPAWEPAPVSGSSSDGDDGFDEEEAVIVCRCKAGDIWQCGDHRVMCGDSTDPEAVKTLMGGGEG